MTKSKKPRRNMWRKLSKKEMIEQYSDILRIYWRDGPVEHLLDKFFQNIHSGKIKIK